MRHGLTSSRERSSYRHTGLSCVFLIPLVAASSSLGEPVEPHQLLGGSLVLAGIGLYALHDLRVRAAEPA